MSDLEPDHHSSSLRGQPGELRGHEPGHRRGAVAPGHRPRAGLRGSARSVPLLHAGQGLWQGRHPGISMNQFSDLIDRYVSAWHETDPDARRQRIATLDPIQFPIGSLDEAVHRHHQRGDDLSQCEVSFQECDRRTGYRSTVTRLVSGFTTSRRRPREVDCGCVARRCPIQFGPRIADLRQAATAARFLPPIPAGDRPSSRPPGRLDSPSGVRLSESSGAGTGGRLGSCVRSYDGRGRCTLVPSAVRAGADGASPETIG
jgi:hypothetical protein